MIEITNVNLTASSFEIKWQLPNVSNTLIKEIKLKNTIDGITSTCILL